MADVLDFFARRAREQWPAQAPAGYRLIAIPELIVPAHDVVVELWPAEGEDLECFVAGSPDPNDTLRGYGQTPIEAINEHERKNFLVQHTTAVIDAFTGYVDPTRRVPRIVRVAATDLPAPSPHIEPPPWKRRRRPA